MLGKDIKFFCFILILLALSITFVITLVRAGTTLLLKDVHKENSKDRSMYNLGFVMTKKNFFLSCHYFSPTSLPSIT